MRGLLSVTAAVFLLLAVDDTSAKRITRLPNGCLVAAAEMQAAVDARGGLAGFGVWSRLVRVSYDGPVGHAYCVYALRNGNLWAYDINRGSRRLFVAGRDIRSVVAGLKRLDPSIRSGDFLD